MSESACRIPIGVGYSGLLPDANCCFCFSITDSIHFRRMLSVQSPRAFSNLSSSVRIVAISVGESMASTSIERHRPPIPFKSRTSPIHFSGSTTSYFSSFIFLQTSLVCPVFDSIKVVTGRQLQVTVLAFFLLDHCTVFDDFGGGWWQLATCWRRGRRHRLLLRRATGQKQVKHQPSYPHALCLRSLVPACRWQSWLHAPMLTRCKGGQQSDG